MCTSVFVNLMNKFVNKASSLFISVFIYSAKSKPFVYTFI